MESAADSTAEEEHRAQQHCPEHKFSNPDEQSWTSGLRTSMAREQTLRWTTTEHPRGDGQVVRQRQRIGVYRIIGEGLPPRHSVNQLLINLNQTLAEPVLQDAEKIFVLNRIVDAQAATTAALYIRVAGYQVVDIPFDFEEYRRHQAPDGLGLLQSDDWWIHTQCNSPSNTDCTQVMQRRNSIIYAMNNNGARNAALDDGFARGFDWVLPFDGNCIFDETQWRVLSDELRRCQHSYVAISMLRAVGGLPGEPQVAFHRTSWLRFNNAFAYGYRPKVELLWRLGVHGIWDHYHDSIFEHEGVCTKVCVQVP